MNSSENIEKINLSDIANISEEEFKKQISAWIDDRGISRKLQSKLRADLFEHFNRTQLGRQMAEQHQLTHRIVLSPLILVLNTLVAEFLHAEDCHFTLSVFANEVPYKNTLPNFELTPSKQLFHFSDTELTDIFEAIGIRRGSEQTIRKFYMDCGKNTQSDSVNRSLLYCIFKIIIKQSDCDDSKQNKAFANESKKAVKSNEKNVNTSNVSSASQQSSSSNQKSCEKKLSSRSKHEQNKISLRYFKYVNRYLDILSDRVHDMCKDLAEKRSNAKRQPSDSSIQESSLKKDLRKMIENINQLTKSKRKSKRFQDVLNSIERLSLSVEKCSGNLEDMLMALNTQTKNMISSDQHSKMPEKKNDCFNGMDYATWLKALKTSSNGKKFIDKLEISLQKTMQKEREDLEKLYEEKTKNYRMLIKLHYKQKYDGNKTKHDTPIDRVETGSVDKISNDNSEKLLAESLATRAIEKEQQIDQIVHSAK